MNAYYRTLLFYSTYMNTDAPGSMLKSNNR